MVKIKIFIDTPIFAIGGVETFAINLALGLNKLNFYEIFLIHSVNKKTDQDLSSNQVNRISNQISIIGIDEYFQVVSNSPGICITVTSWNRVFINQINDFFIENEKLLKQNKIIGFVHNESSQYYDLVYLYEKLFDKIICVSKNAHDFILSKNLSIDNKTVFRPCPTSINIIHPKLKKYSGGNKKIIISFVGRFDDVSKGVFRIPQLLKELKKNNVDFFIKIIGEGPDKFKLIESLSGFEADFMMTSANDTLQVKELLNDVDIIILPSNFEGGPLVIYESMACGVVPVVFNVGNMSNLIIHEQNGFIYKVNDIKGFADAITKLYNNRDLLKSMGEKAFYTVKNQGYFITDYIDFFINIVNEVADNGNYKLNLVSDFENKSKIRNNNLKNWINYTIPEDIIRKYFISNYFDLLENNLKNNDQKELKTQNTHVLTDKIKQLNIEVEILKSENQHLNDSFTQIKNEKSWYARTYDHLPKWYLKLGFIFRKL